MLLGGGGENMELVEEEDNGHGVTGRYFAKKNHLSLMILYSNKTLLFS